MACRLNTETIMKSVAVLLVDDNPDLQEALRLYLECQGLSVSVAGDGYQALQVLFQQKQNIAAVITDIMMPGVDGLELIRRVRASSELAGLPVIALTAYDDSFIARAKMAGADAVLRKPDELDDLVGTI